VRAADGGSTAWIGISFRATSADAPEVTVDEVLPGAPAHRAGLLTGDRIVRWNGRQDVNAAIRSGRLEVGDTVRLSIRREGARDRELVVVAEARPPNLAWGPPGDVRELAAARLRMQMDSLIARSEAQFRTFQGDSMTVRRYLAPGVPLDSLFRTYSTNGFFVFPQTEADRSEVYQQLQRQAARIGSVADSVRRVATQRAFQMAESARADGSFDPPLALLLAGGRSGVAGAELADLGAGLSSYFGVGQGALVLKVAPETPAARAGLQEGDVIVAADGRSVARVADLRQVLAQTGRERSISLEVVRHGARQTITIPR
jgi:predicted metalloprotease with PDZ domain